MMRRVVLLHFAAVLLLGIGLLPSVGTLSAQDTENRLSRVVIVPPHTLDDYRSVREMFGNPDQWKQTGEYADGISFYCGYINKRYSDDELKNIFDIMRSKNLTLELEVCTVKEFEPVGSKLFRTNKRMFDRFIACGGTIHAISMDEPLVGAVKIGKDMAYAVKETADFVELMRKEYPDVLVGDIEAYPHFDADELIEWINLLQTELKKRNVRGLDFFRIDVDWTHFASGKSATNPRIGKGNWREVVRIENHCKRIKLPFSMIFWAANHGTIKKLGLVDEKTWYIGVMRMGDDYFMHGGKPDQLVVQSWLQIPKEIIPETKPYTFTNSVVDFYEKFVKEKPSE